MLSKVGALKSKKRQPDGTVRHKTRMINDSKESGTSSASLRTHKSQLPLATGAVRGIVGLMKPRCSDTKSAHSNDGIELLITDVSDAFFLVPLRSVERKYFVLWF